MSITLTEAVKITGKSKSTLTRAIASGKLSASRSEDEKTYMVDESELARVFPFVSANHGSPDDSPPVTSPESLSAELELELVKTQIAEIKQMHRREVDRMESQIDDLKQERDDWKTQASNQTLLLRHEQERQVEPPKRFFGIF
jgi:hypothetical protein